MTKPIQIKSLTLGEGMPKICIPLTGTTKEALIEEAEKAAEAGADLVEWRADFFENLSDREKREEVLTAISDKLGRIPLLFTIRTKKEGGNLAVSTEDYVNINLCVGKTKKADLIDVEVFGDELEKVSLIAGLHEVGAVVIASSHDFAGTDAREILLERFKIMDRTGADILKMAVMPHEFEDVASIMLATSDMAKLYTEKPLISMSMGELGALSRVAGESCGSCVTFGTVGKASAPGQIPIDSLRNMLKVLHMKNKNN